MEPESPPPGESGIAAGPPTAEGFVSPPVPPSPSEFPPLESPAGPLLPPCPVPVEAPRGSAAHAVEVPCGPAAPPEEPLEVDPVVEPGPPTAKPKAPRPSRRRGDSVGLVRYYRRTILLVLALLLAFGAAGWRFRWHVLHEILLLSDGNRLRWDAETSMVPLLCETLAHDHSATRRRRAAQMLDDGPVAFTPEAWPFLLAALSDRDVAVEEAAWPSFVSAGGPHGEHIHIRRWVRDLSTGHCVEVIRSARSPSVRRNFLDLLKDESGDAYWPTARWTLANTPDPETADVVLRDVRPILYHSEAGLPRTNENRMTDCLLAGLANSHVKIRDRCRRLSLDYAYGHINKDALIEWIGSTRDFNTWERTVFFARRDSPDRWMSALKARLASEADYDLALEICAVLSQLVGDARETEFLRAGIENPDPRIRECFQLLLDGVQRANELPVEPDDGR